MASDRVMDSYTSRSTNTNAVRGGSGKANVSSASKRTKKNTPSSTSTRAPRLSSLFNGAPHLAKQHSRGGVRSARQQSGGGDYLRGNDETLAGYYTDTRSLYDANNLPSGIPRSSQSGFPSEAAIPTNILNQPSSLISPRIHDTVMFPRQEGSPQFYLPTHGNGQAPPHSSHYTSNFHMTGGKSTSQTATKANSTNGSGRGRPAGPYTPPTRAAPAGSAAVSSSRPSKNGRGRGSSGSDFRSLLQP